MEQGGPGNSSVRGAQRHTGEARSDTDRDNVMKTLKTHKPVAIVNEMYVNECQ